MRLYVAFLLLVLSGVLVLAAPDYGVNLVPNSGFELDNGSDYGFGDAIAGNKVADGFKVGFYPAGSVAREAGNTPDGNYYYHFMSVRSTFNNADGRSTSVAVGGNGKLIVNVSVEGGKAYAFDALGRGPNESARSYYAGIGVTPMNTSRFFVEFQSNGKSLFSRYTTMANKYTYPYLAEGTPESVGNAFKADILVVAPAAASWQRFSLSSGFGSSAFVAPADATNMLVTYRVDPPEDTIISEFYLDGVRVVEQRYVLSVSADSDREARLAGELVGLYANITDFESLAPVRSASCVLSFNGSVRGMTFNASSGLYEAYLVPPGVGLYSYNVSCSGGILSEPLAADGTAAVIFPAKTVYYGMPVAPANLNARYYYLSNTSDKGFLFNDSTLSFYARYFDGYVMLPALQFVQPFESSDGWVNLTLFANASVLQRNGFTGGLMHRYTAYWGGSDVRLSAWFDDAGWNAWTNTYARNWARALRQAGYEGIHFDGEGALFNAYALSNESNWDSSINPGCATTGGTPIFGEAVINTDSRGYRSCNATWVVDGTRQAVITMPRTQLFEYRAYEAVDKGHTEAEIRVKARQRGCELMTALTDEYPNITVHINPAGIPVTAGRLNQLDLIVDFVGGMTCAGKGKIGLMPQETYIMSNPASLVAERDGIMSVYAANATNPDFFKANASVAIAFWPTMMYRLPDDSLKNLSCAIHYEYMMPRAFSLALKAAKTLSPDRVYIYDQPDMFAPFFTLYNGTYDLKKDYWNGSILFEQPYFEYCEFPDWVGKAYFDALAAVKVDPVRASLSISPVAGTVRAGSPVQLRLSSSGPASITLDSCHDAVKVEHSGSDAWLYNWGNGSCRTLVIPARGYMSLTVPAGYFGYSGVYSLSVRGVSASVIVSGGGQWTATPVPSGPYLPYNATAHGKKLILFWHGDSLANRDAGYAQLAGDMQVNPDTLPVVTRVESLGFDGLAYVNTTSVYSGSTQVAMAYSVFTRSRINYSIFDPAIDVLANLSSTRQFYRNSLQQVWVCPGLSAANGTDGARYTAWLFTFMDDGAWANVTANAADAGAALKRAGAAGIILDTEDYSTKCFNYTELARRDAGAAALGLDGARALARKRGKAFAQALTAQYPNMTILLTYAQANLARERYWYEKSGPSASGYSNLDLMDAFLGGVYEGAPKAKIVDGLENTYLSASRAGLSIWRSMARGEPTVFSSIYPKLDQGYYGNATTGFAMWLNQPTANTKYIPRLNASKDNYWLPEAIAPNLSMRLRMADEYVWVFASPPQSNIYTGENLSMDYFNAITFMRSNPPVGDSPPILPEFLLPAAVAGVPWAYRLPAATASDGFNAPDPSGDYADAVVVYPDLLPQGAWFDEAARTIHWTPTDSQVGANVFTLVASDGVASSRTPLLTSVAGRHALKLSRGWNLLSVPYASLGVKASSCGDVWLWGFDGGKYYPASFAALAPFAGYWAYTLQDCSVTLAGGAQQAFFVPLKAGGWSLVGGFSGEFDVSSLAGCSFIGGPLEYVSSTNSYGKAVRLKEGGAYWVKVASACTLYVKSG